MLSILADVFMTAAGQARDLPRTDGRYLPQVRQRTERRHGRSGLKAYRFDRNRDLW